MKARLVFGLILFLYAPTTWGVNDHVSSATHDYYLLPDAIYTVDKKTGEKSYYNFGRIKIHRLARIGDTFYALYSIYVTYSILGHDVFLTKATHLESLHHKNIRVGPKYPCSNVGLKIFKDILYCTCDIIKGIKVYSTDLSLLGTIELGSFVQDLFFTKSGNAYAQSGNEWSPDGFYKIDLEKHTAQRLATRTDQVAFHPDYVFFYSKSEPSTTLRFLSLKEPVVEKTISFDHAIFFVHVYKDLAFAFTDNGIVYCINTDTQSIDADSSLLRPFTKLNTLTLTDDHHVYLFELEGKGSLWVFDLRSKKWLGKCTHYCMAFANLMSTTHLCYNDKRIPLFPHKESIDLLKTQNSLRDFVDCCPKAFCFEEKDCEVVLNQPFKDFAKAIQDLGRLSYEHIFDYLDPTLALLILVGMEDDHLTNYLTSGEWKLRQTDIHERLFYRLWLQQTDRAQSLIMALLLIKDPLAQDFYKHASTYGMGAIGVMPYLKRQVQRLKSKL